MPLPLPRDVAFLPPEEAESLIIASLPTGVGLSIEMTPRGFEATVTDPTGTVCYRGVSPDRRIALFDAYGFLLKEAGAKPHHPAWQRRAEVQIPIRYGRMSYQGDIQLPDPQDLDPQEILRVYGIQPRKG